MQFNRGCSVIMMNHPFSCDTLREAVEFAERRIAQNFDNPKIGLAKRRSR